MGLSRRKRLAFAVIVGLGVGLAFEAGARLTRYGDDQWFYQQAYDRLFNSLPILPDADNYHRRFGFLPSANLVEQVQSEEFAFTLRTNSRGFRAGELTPRRPDEYRVLLLGDSFFGGIGVDESDMVGAQLERLEQQQLGSRQLSTVNYAVAGYATVQELAVLETYLAEVDPDLVIVGLFTANDLLPNAVSHLDANGNFAYLEEKTDRAYAELRRRLWPWSASVALRPLVLRGLVPRVRYQMAVEAWVLEGTQQALREFRRQTAAAGVALTVVVIPPRDAVGGGLTAAWSGSRTVGEALTEWCRGEGIEVVDLLSSMHGKADRDAYFYPVNGHFNARGQAAMAEAIFAAALRERLAHGTGQSP